MGAAAPAAAAATSVGAVGVSSSVGTASLADFFPALSFDNGGATAEA